MTRWLKKEAASHWSLRGLNACRILSFAVCLCYLLSITACVTIAPEDGVQYFKRRAGVDLAAYDREIGGIFQSANRFNEQADLSSGKVRLALLSAYPIGTSKQLIFPRHEAQSIRMYEVHYAWKGNGKYISSVRGGTTREFEMVVDSPQEKYQRQVETAILIAPWRHQLSFEFDTENTLLDIRVSHSSGK